MDRNTGTCIDSCIHGVDVGVGNGAAASNGALSISHSLGLDSDPSFWKQPRIVLGKDARFGMC